MIEYIISFNDIFVKRFSKKIKNLFCIKLELIKMLYNEVDSKDNN